MTTHNASLADTAGGLAKADMLLGEIDSATTESAIRKALFQVETVKEALKAADMFRDKSIQFARYEALALIKVVEVCGDTKLISGKYRKLAAEWLVGLTEEERNAYISMCADGKTIDNIYRDNIYRPMQRVALSDAVSDCKDMARTMLRQDGIVSVPDVVQRHINDFPRSMRKDIVNGVRDAIRQAGGVGIGDDRGTYINPDKHSLYVSDALATRIAAVARDIESIADLAEKCESKPVFRVKGNGNQITVTDVVYLILAGVGCAEVIFDSPSAKKSSVSILRQIAGDV